VLDTPEVMRQRVGQPDRRTMPCITGRGASVARGSAWSDSWARWHQLFRQYLWDRHRTTVAIKKS